MNNYKVWFYTKHNPNLQSGVIHANSEDHARRMFEVTGCQVESVERVNTCLCYEMIGDNSHCPDHGHLSYRGPILADGCGNDDDLYNFAKGG